MPKNPNIETNQSINIYEEIEKKARRAKNEKTSSHITVRLTDEEMKLVKEQAEAGYYSVSAYVRKVVLEHIKAQTK